MITFDAATIDSTGAFLISELERLDPTINEPLYSVSWRRDIVLREDISIADETASFTNSSFAAVGGIQPNGISWAGKDSNAIASLALDIGKTPQPLHLWAMELKWSVIELQQGEQLGRPIDTQYFDGMNIKWNMDADQLVYIGDTSINTAQVGLLNSSNVTAANVINNAGGTSKLWTAKTPAEMLGDINTALTAAWTATGYTTAPTDLRLPPAQFAYITSQMVSTAGNMSILEFLRQNSLAMTTNGRPLNIQPLKWLTGRGASGTDRMLIYTNDPKFVRFPLVPLMRTPLEYRSLYQLTTYYGRFGQVEFRYPETVRYADGI